MFLALIQLVLTYPSNGESGPGSEKYTFLSHLFDLTKVRTLGFESYDLSRHEADVQQHADIYTIEILHAIDLKIQYYICVR